LFDFIARKDHMRKSQY